ncbi:uncharacterized protein CDAR_54191 [Caerostris darwini]|uniref:Uncharacterized protein n=1 Tax=Caerostris darwini TaxID=1538125 RepID=A0AAV4QAG1_9ARAC|nr:uncharacterized protein CDAR_54191 [Caerostris darwini]
MDSEPVDSTTETLSMLMARGITVSTIEPNIGSEDSPSLLPSMPIFPCADPPTSTEYTTKSLSQIDVTQYVDIFGQFLDRTKCFIAIRFKQHLVHYRGNGYLQNPIKPPENSVIVVGPQIPAISMETKSNVLVFQVHGHGLNGYIPVPSASEHDLLRSILSREYIITDVMERNTLFALVKVNPLIKKWKQCRRDKAYRAMVHLTTQALNDDFNINDLPYLRFFKRNKYDPVHFNTWYLLIHRITFKHVSRYILKLPSTQLFHQIYQIFNKSETHEWVAPSDIYQCEILFVDNVPLGVAFRMENDMVEYVSPMVVSYQTQVYKDSNYIECNRWIPLYQSKEHWKTYGVSWYVCRLGYESETLKSVLAWLAIQTVEKYRLLYMDLCQVYEIVYGGDVKTRWRSKPLSRPSTNLPNPSQLPDPPTKPPLPRHYSVDACEKECERLKEKLASLQRLHDEECKQLKNTCEHKLSDSENTHTCQLRMKQNTHAKELDQMKNNYEKNISDLESLLTETRQEKQTIERNLNSVLDTTKREKCNLQDRLDRCRHEMEDLKTRFSRTTQVHKEDLERERSVLKREMDQLKQCSPSNDMQVFKDEMMHILNNFMQNMTRNFEIPQEILQQFLKFQQFWQQQSQSFEDMSALPSQPTGLFSHPTPTLAPSSANLALPNASDNRIVPREMCDEAACAVVPSNGNDQIIHYLEETLDRLLSTEQLRRVLTPFQLDAKFNKLQQQMDLALVSNHEKTSLTVDQIHDMLRQTKTDIENMSSHLIERVTGLLSNTKCDSELVLAHQQLEAEVLNLKKCQSENQFLRNWLSQNHPNIAILPDWDQALVHYIVTAKNDYDHFYNKMVEQCTQLSNHLGIVDIQPDTLFTKVSEQLTANYIQHVSTISEYLRENYPDSPAGEIIQILEANRDVTMTDVPPLEDAPQLKSIEYHVNDSCTVEEILDEVDSNGEKSTSHQKSPINNENKTLQNNLDQEKKTCQKYKNRWHKANDKLKKYEESSQQQQIHYNNLLTEANNNLKKCEEDCQQQQIHYNNLLIEANNNLKKCENDNRQQQTLYEQCKFELNNANRQLEMSEDKSTQQQALYEQCKTKLEETNHQMDIILKQCTTLCQHLGISPIPEWDTFAKNVSRVIEYNMEELKQSLAHFDKLYEVWLKELNVSDPVSKEEFINVIKQWKTKNIELSKSNDEIEKLKNSLKEQTEAYEKKRCLLKRRLVVSEHLSSTQLDSWCDRHSFPSCGSTLMSPNDRENRYQILNVESENCIPSV